MILTMVITLSTMVVPTMAGTDQPSSWAQFSVDKGLENGVLAPKFQRDYQRYLTREEFAELAVDIILGMHENQIGYNRTKYEEKYLPVYDVDVEKFLEYVETDANFQDTDNPAIEVAYALGLINGTSETKFSPEQLITREQMAKMLNNYFGLVSFAPSNNESIPIGEKLEDFNQVSDWAKDSVNWAYHRTLMNGTRAYEIGYIEGEYDESGNYKSYVTEKGLFSPKANVTLEQAITMLLRGVGHTDYSMYGQLFIRGFVNITSEKLYTGYEVEKDIVKVKTSEYDWAYASERTFPELNDKAEHLRDAYTTSQLQNALGGAGWYNYDFRIINKYKAVEDLILKHAIIDNGAFTFEKNPSDDYFCIARKNPNVSLIDYLEYKTKDGQVHDLKFEYTILD